jgi:hypothetical protein
MARGLPYWAGVMKPQTGIRRYESHAGVRWMLAAGLSMAVSFGVLLAGCCDECDRPIERIVVADNLPPMAPDGVYSVTGDGQVTLYWNPNREPDLAGYDIYWNDEATGYYEFMATVPPYENWYVDTDVVNGEMYYYAVLAFDDEGLESELSYETVFDTPRPEGENLILFDYLLGQSGDLSGYDFSSLSGTAQVRVDPTTDVYFGAPNGVPTLFAARAGVDLQDYGYIDLVDVDWAPTGGWSLIDQVEMIQGHSYIVRITDQATGVFHMAKVYVRSISSESITLDWAYQIADKSLELAPGGGAQP